MKNNLLGKTIILGIIVLFIGAGVYPAFAVEIKSTMINNKNDEDCGCDVKIEYKQVIAERLIEKLEIYLNNKFLKTSSIPGFEDEFNDIINAFNSDRPICELILKINASIYPLVQDLYDQLIQHKLHPIRGRIYAFSILILFTINIYVIPLWFLLDCGEWQ